MATQLAARLAKEVHANASERSTRDYEQIARELPPGISTREGRQRWLRDARRRLEEELDVERHANAEYEVYRARGVMKNGRGFGSPPKPL